MVKNFAQEYSTKYQKETPTFMDNAMELFASYRWPGNVRELRNVVERMIIFMDNQRKHMEIKVLQQKYLGFQG
ncbi:hypothetical protein LWS67_13110 [Bacillus atrophaeus]|uniref:hypothetical protein n=1 Tax=Bacillus atrophaeus TaxID=1452 RepID=UPI001EFAA3B0|nr:hypothetical protein [Bacillus atrophaeus]MCG8397476.1 hypothetical protein [Bacillus atrophaeus]